MFYDSLINRTLLIYFANDWVNKQIKCTYCPLRKETNEKSDWLRSSYDWKREMQRFLKHRSWDYKTNKQRQWLEWTLEVIWFNNSIVYNQNHPHDSACMPQKQGYIHCFLFVFAIICFFCYFCLQVDFSLDVINSLILIERMISNK